MDTAILAWTTHAHSYEVPNTANSFTSLIDKAGYGLAISCNYNSFCPQISEGGVSTVFFSKSEKEKKSSSGHPGGEGTVFPLIISDVSNVMHDS